MKFSIIIPVRSINEFLEENISHIKNLKYRDFEVIIVLDHPETYDFENDSRFRIIASGSLGPGEKRNLAAAQATGDVLVFLDDDAYPRTDWLTQANKILRDKSVYALGAPAITPENSSFLEKLSGKVLESWLSSGGTVYRHVPDRFRSVDDYPTVNLFVRRQAFMDVGGFTTEFWPGEDTKLCLDLVNYFGKKFIYDPRPIVFHHRRQLFIPHLKQISRYGQHRGQFARIYPETSRLPMYFVPTMFVAGLVLGGFLSLLIPSLRPVYLTILFIYLSLVFFEGLKVAFSENDYTAGILVSLGVFLTHLVYGINFAIGFVKRPTLQLRNFDKSTGNYLGG